MEDVFVAAMIIEGLLRFIFSRSILLFIYLLYNYMIWKAVLCIEDSAIDKKQWTLPSQLHRVPWARLNTLTSQVSQTMRSMKMARLR